MGWKFWDRADADEKAQQAREESGATAMNHDPDVRNAMRGIFTGKYAAEAAAYPAAWAPETRNVAVARSIAHDKGFNDSGTHWTGDEWKASNTGVPFAVQIAPYVIGGVTAAGAGGAFGGGTGGVSNLGGTGGLVGSGEASVVGGPITATQAGYGGSVLGAGGGGGGLSVGQMLAKTAGGKSGMGLNYTDLILGGTGQALNLYGQNKALNANQSALDQQLESTKYATDAQTKSAAESLAFLRQQAAYDASVAEANRFGDYDQWAAKQEQLGSVGSMLGLPARRIPTYVPLPAYTSGAPGAPGQAAPAGPVPTIAGGDIAAQVADYYKARGVTPNPTSVDYWAQKWNEFGARDPEYFNRRLAAADEFGGAPGPVATVAAPRRNQALAQPLGTVGQYFADASAGIGKLEMPTAQPLASAPTKRPRWTPYRGPSGPGPVSSYL